MGALPTVNPPPYNPFRVLDREPSLPGFDKDDHRDHQDHEDDQEKDGDDTHLPHPEKFVGAGHGIGHSGDDPCENDQGDTVPNPSFCNLFAQPHDEGSTSGEGDDGHDPEGPSWIHDDHFAGRPSHILQANSDPKSLDDTENDGSIASILNNLFSADFSLFLELGEIRNDHREKLEDDRGADIRHNTQGEDREPLQCPP